MVGILAIAAWVIGCGVDLWTSARMDAYADLREADPLTRNAQGQFSLLGGLCVSTAEGALLIWLAFVMPVVGETLLLAAAGAHGFAAWHNARLEATDTTPKSKGYKVK